MRDTANSISLIIKGNPQQAEEAAKAHGVPITIVRRAMKTRWRAGGVETVAITTDEHRIKIVKWFAETERQPFPIGSLMLFTDLD